MSLLFLPAQRGALTSLPASVRNALLVEMGKIEADQLQKFAKIDTAINVNFINNSERFIDVFLEHGGGFERIARRLKNEDLGDMAKTIEQLLKGVYFVGKNRQEVIITRGRNTPIPITNTSTGQSEILRILQDIFISTAFTERSEYKIIEEPEAHLPPKAQHQLLELFGKLIASTDNQVLFTTHSDHIINGLSVLVKKAILSNNDINIYYLQHDDDSQLTSSVPVPIRADGFIKHPPRGFFDQIARDLNVLYG